MKNERGNLFFGDQRAGSPVSLSEKLLLYMECFVSGHEEQHDISKLVRVLQVGDHIGQLGEDQVRLNAGSSHIPHRRFTGQHQDASHAVVYAGGHVGI